MILYLGSSSLVELYTAGQHSESVREWVRAAEIVATCRIAYTEIMSALNIRLRREDLSRKDYDIVVKCFSEDWNNIVKVDFDDLEAGNLIEKYALTRFGALHLSAAKLILAEYEKHKSRSKFENINPNGISLLFSSKDEALCVAAVNEGLMVLPLN